MRNLAKIFAVVLVVAEFGSAMAADSAKQKMASDIVDLFKLEEYSYNIVERSARNADTHSCFDSTFYPQLKTEFHKYYNNKTRKILIDKMSATYSADVLNDVYGFYSNTKVGQDIIQINLNASTAKNQEETFKGIKPASESDMNKAIDYARGKDSFVKLRTFASDFIVNQETQQTKTDDFISTAPMTNLINSYIDKDSCRPKKQSATKQGN